MTTDITELAQSLKAAAEKATPGPWYVHDNPCEDGNYGIDTSDKEFLAEAVVWWGFARQSIWREEDAKYIALANPANILALVEALEKAQQERDNWCTTFDNERFRADKLKAYIDDMEPIRAAAEKLVRCKGRYHSEQNYRALAALFGVNTPDLPPLEHENVHYADAAEMEIAALRQRIAELEESHAQVIQSRDHYKRMLEEGLEQLAESRTVTVKLPDLRQIVSGDRYVWSDGVYNYSQDVKAILADAGIKVEAE
ncbi:TPA: ead/Ea22-like family protein [Klebsiella pneumoniae]|nr:ead/Ea22-like family protein [Klebsiella pneumoniae]HDT5505520.1 ead/Ea22-like family protein [Klebsiella pneumoniae subsp. pneumoniae]HDU3584798.1 ead/Ea22-like family protein [Klebsiella pneumoniae]HDU5686177.1 ead/Ea22-like family protein [Klebsiella pneumoniae]HDU5765852.1 ead/Ea22-like family protein [Klebsiella pneumoniae subsp. pneumoniae]